MIRNFGNILKSINFYTCNKISFKKEINLQFQKKDFELNLYKYFLMKPEIRQKY